MNNHQTITPVNIPNPYVGNYLVYFVTKYSLIPDQIIDITPLDNFCRIYNSKYISGGSKIVQHESLELDTVTSIFSMT